MVVIVIVIWKINHHYWWHFMIVIIILLWFFMICHPLNNSLFAIQFLLLKLGAQIKCSILCCHNGCCFAFAIQVQSVVSSGYLDAFFVFFFPLEYILTIYYIQARIAQLVAYQLGIGEVPGSNPGKGDNFSVKIFNLIVRI